jgi:hypothetical protein
MIYDDLTHRIGADYEALIFAFKGIYLAAVAPGAQLSPAALKSAEREAHRLAHAFLTRAEDEMTSYASEQGADASRVGYALDALKVTLAQNIKGVLRAMRVGQTGVASLVKGASGGMGQLVQQKIGGVEFKAQDSLGRKFPAETIVKTTVRQFAVQTSVDAAVAEAVRLGHDAIQVVTPDGDAQRVLLKDLPEQRGRLFHPNTRLEAHV